MTRGFNWPNTRTAAASSHSITAYSLRHRPVSVLFMANSVVIPLMRFAPERLAK